MKRPDIKDYTETLEVSYYNGKTASVYNVDYKSYSENLEKYCDYLESELNIKPIV